MYKFGRYFAVTIAITMVFLANTVNVAFSPMFLREVESTEEFSADRGSMLTPTQPDSGFYSGSKEMHNEKSESSFQNIWGLDAFNKDSRFDGIKERGDFACFDEDSAELVIGVNNAKPEAYTNLVDEISRNQGEIVNKVSIEGEVIAVVADIPWNATSSFTEKVQKIGLARYVEPNMKFQAQFVPNDPYWTYQWGPQKIESDWAWNTTTGNSSILVAVIDSGIDYNHPDLEGNYVTLGYDWVNDDSDPLDDFGHGTHCAGIIAAALNNTVGIAGIANVSIMAEKGLDAYGSGWEDDLANAIIHAVDQGADVLSNSWGGYGESMLIHDAVQYAYNQSVLVIAAAGNEAWSMKLYPAAYDEVVAVTATDSYDDPASFTNFGDWVEVAAPGVDIYSTMPTYHVTLNDYGYNQTYDYMNGTSMACPHVAGVAALIWSQFANATRDWVRAQLRYTADDLGNPGFDEYYGYGRINAKNAVEQAPPNHDLLIFDWNRPQYVKLGESATFNINVLNFGASNETDVEVHLLVNDSSINSTYISLLQGATSTTVSLSWTPTSEGAHNITYYVVPVPGETIIENNQITEILYVIAPPPETNWMLLETDPDEGVGTNLKSIYGQVQSDIVYFKVEHHRSWTTINDIDTAVFIDADQDASTGLPDGAYPYQDTDIGADYVIVVGWEATDMWKWDPITEMWDLNNPISLAYLDAPEGSNVFIVGVFFADVETTGIVDCAVADVPSNWDWMPNIGHFTCVVIRCEHELTVSIEAPKQLEPGKTSVINASVQNIGLNTETDVEIHLLVNDTQVASETVAELANGTSYTINYSWTPIVEGIYNVTAYTPPVPDENITINNVATTMVRVCYIEVAVISDNSELLAVTPILDSMGMGYDIYNNNYYYLYTENFDLLLNYKAVIFYTNYRWITSTEHSTLESYLSLGGNLLVTGFDCLVSDALLADLVRSSSTGDNMGESDLYVVEDTHPIMNGPYGIFPAGYHIYGLYSDCDMAEADTTRNAVTVAELSDGYDRIIATEGLPGKVVFWNGRGENDWTWNSDCEAMFKNIIDWMISIQVSINPCAGSPGTKVTVTGTGATVNGTVSIYWDDTLMGNTIANADGNFTYLLTVPSEATIGIHDIVVMDVATGRTGSMSFRVILIALNPTEGPIGTNVTVNGAGFAPESQVTVTFNDMLIGYTIIDGFGNFTFVFNIPLSTAGQYYIKALDAEGNHVCKKFTVVDVTSLDVQIDVGAMHFKGEIAEFYAQTTFKGQAADAAITSAVLYKPDGTTETLTAQQVTTGLYKISYTIVGNETGTYTLVITASYVTDTVQANGTSFKCFLVSQKLTDVVLTIQEINGDIVDILIPDVGAIKANLTAINLRLISMNGTVAWIQTTLGLAMTDIQTINATVLSINGTTAIIQTTLGAMNGTITSIEGDIATIVIPGVGQIETDISSLKETQEAWVIPQYVITISALIAAASSTLALIFLRRKKTEKAG